MDAAWSSQTDQENATAEIANSTSAGDIFEQEYKPWKGELNPRWMRNWSILRHHILVSRKAIVHGVGLLEFSW